MKQIFLALDWSNLAFRSLYMQSFTNGNALITYNDQEEINAYIAKLATDIAFIIRIFNPAKVIFAADSKNAWRKDVLSTYKSGRTKDERVNWENIYEALNEFKKHLTNIGFVFLETPRAEADDLMAMLKETLFEETEFANTNLILVSADADIRQLIEFRPTTNQYCMVFNEIGKGASGKRHLYTNRDIMNWYNSKDDVINDIFHFSEGDANKTYLKNLLMLNRKIEMEETDPKNILLSKVFCGDDGDSVPAFYDWYNKGKKVRVTNSKFVKILEKLEAHDISIIDAKKKQLKPILESVCKRQINDIDVEARLLRQERLVQLKSDLFPDIIQEYKPEIKNLLSQSKFINCTNLAMKDLISNSSFDSVLRPRKAKDADIFRGMEKYFDSLELTPLF